MSRRKSYPDKEFMLEKISWSEKIVDKDSDYKDYAGADPQDALRLAKIDLTLFMLPKNHPFRLMLKLARLYLLQKKKAFFASVRMTELSQLGAIKAGKPFNIRAELAKYK